MTIAAGAISAALVFTISENDYPWFYVRNIFGILFVLFLPGYALIKALFVANTTMENIGIAEQFALSVVMSLAVVSVVGLILNYSPWGLDLSAMVLSLLAFSSIIATVAVVRIHLLARTVGAPHEKSFFQANSLKPAS